MTYGLYVRREVDRRLGVTDSIFQDHADEELYVT
jgi:hypothetical protein